MRQAKLGIAAALAASLAACGGGGGGRPATVSTPVVRAAPAADVEAVVQLLDAGEVGKAKKALARIAKASPGDPRVQLLHDSLTRDPVDLLGPESFAYTAKPGDTMLGLAQRFLGNRMKAYQLARYNALATPSALAAGTVLRIPAPAAAPRPAIAAPRPEPARPAARPAPRARPPVVAASPAPPPAAPARNPAASAQARAAGLAALNGGRVAQAIQQLRRAAALDPANPAVARDLARAERIAQTVRARR
jgi:hypothetical protein